MSNIRLLFADTLEPISSDYSDPLRYYLNITQSTEQGIRIIAVTDSGYYSENTVISISADSNKIQLAPDVSGSAGTYQAAGTSFNLGTIDSDYTYFWAKSVTVAGDIIENDITVSIEISGEIFADYSAPDTSWSDTMIASYESLHPEQAGWFTTQIGQEAKNALVDRLNLGTYLYDTFGPSGQNKAVCDFVYLLYADGDTVASESAKTGQVLRWDFGLTQYSQNNMPVHTGGGIITISSTDGWLGITAFRAELSNIIGALPRFNFPNLLNSFNVRGNRIDRAIPNYDMPLCQGFYVYDNLIPGTAPNLLFINIPHEGYFKLDNNKFSSFESLLETIYNNRSSFTNPFPGLDISGGENAEPLPVGKTPEQAYTDGNVGTGKWYIHVLQNDPLTEGFNKWNILIEYESDPIPLYEVTFTEDNSLENVEIEIT